MAPGRKEMETLHSLPYHREGEFENRMLPCWSSGLSERWYQLKGRVPLTVQLGCAKLLLARERIVTRGERSPLDSLGRPIMINARWSSHCDIDDGYSSRR
jgi:hypothetical protein